LIERLCGAVIRRLADRCADDEPARRRGGRLDILAVGADIADMREGEGDDLAGIGRVGQDFLIAGDRGVETDFADRLARRADAAPPKTVPSASTRAALQSGGRGFCIAAVGWLIK
jgi:hypothetical protein